MNVDTIDYFSLDHPLRKLASKISFHVRRKIFASFMEILRPTARSRVLDVGVTPDRTLPESNFLESLYPYKDHLVVTSIEDASHLEQEYPGIRFVRTERMDLPFTDKSFNIVFCSAVLEHVGDYDQQKLFVAELFRVSERFFIITPNRQFPMEFHTFIPFLHWLPLSLHRAILQALGMEFWSRTENLNLLTPRSLRKVIAAAQCARIKNQFLFGFPSNLIAYGYSPPL
jgi:SAM-dependent methyltransferase